MITYKNKLKDIRTGLNISQSRAASDLGISIRSLCRYENGESEPVISLAFEMADYYNTTFDEIFTRQVS